MIKNIKITKIHNNETLTHLEEFETLVGNKEHYIKFFHKRDINENIPDIGWFSSPFQSMINLWKNFITENSIAIDIGAFDGDTSIPMGVLVGDSGKVISFEPGLQFCYTFNLNCELNKNLNIDPYNLAIMEKDGLYEFLYSPEYENGGFKDKTSIIGNYTRSKFVRGINFIKHFENKINFKDISFIKIDTEGHDMNVIHSLLPIIDFLRPPIQIEWFPSTDINILNFIKNFNYKSMDCATGIIYNSLPPQWTDDLILIPN